MTALRLDEFEDLNTSQTLLLLVLASFANEDAICWPSQSTLAKKVKVTRQCVNKSLKLLETKGYIAIAGISKNPNGRKTKIYKMLIEPLVKPLADSTGTMEYTETDTSYGYQKRMDNWSREWAEEDGYTH